ncbi:hypothetical protein [Lactiplantibacillus plantarum]|uniref:hypothetical protein n=1 Tax=Lactiplantibacillus plantarum TaxID=1590 RepID=UPI002012566D|nr:hypothetical protein [Lactiplantibacillus plantarum]
MLLETYQYRSFIKQTGNISIERDWEKLFDEAWLIKHEYAASDDWLDHRIYSSLGRQANNQSLPT